MDDKKLKELTEASILNHMEGVNEIIKLDEVIKISEKYDLNLLGIANVLVTSLIEDRTALSNKEVMDIVEETIHKLSEKTNMHPVDSTVMLIKILTDLIVQVSEFEKINK